MEKCDAGILETLDEVRLGGIGNCSFSDQSEGRMAGLGARFDDEFSDIAGAADDQDLAFFRHSGNKGRPGFDLQGRRRDLAVFRPKTRKEK